LLIAACSKPSTRDTVIDVNSDVKAGEVGDVAAKTFLGKTAWLDLGKINAKFGQT